MRLSLAPLTCDDSTYDEIFESCCLRDAGVGHEPNAQDLPVVTLVPAPWVDLDARVS